jgi:fumarate hydratase class I
MAIGGASPEANLRALKLATLGALETASALEIADASLHPQRCPELEAAAMDLARRSGIGAQLGGEAMALDARIYRLPRHAASVAVSLGVACCARWHAWAFVRGGEAWIERQGEARAARDGLPREPISQEMATPARIDFSEPFGEALSRLRALRAGDEVRVSGPVLVARDAAHARLAREIERGAPDWSKDRPIFYAGPTEAQEGMPSGSFGPTTASRMDEWLEPFMRRGISLVTIAKGNRGAAAADACRRYGGVYLATTGGTAALFARDHVRDSRIVAWDELGMEAVRLVTLDSLPAIVAIDSTGRDFYAEL